MLGSTLEIGGPSDTTDYGADVAIDSQGDAVFAYADSNFDSIIARRLSATGTLATPQSIASNMINQPSPPDIASDANGDTVVAWINTGNFTGHRVQARTMNSRGVLGQTRTVSPSYAGNQPVVDQHVATDASGDSVVIWTHLDGLDGETDRSRHASSRSTARWAR